MLDFANEEAVAEEHPPLAFVATRRYGKKKWWVIAALTVIAALVVALWWRPWSSNSVAASTTAPNPGEHTTSPFGASCPRQEIPDPFQISGFRCVSDAEYAQWQNDLWVQYRQNMTAHNADLKSAQDDLQAKFDAGATLSDKLGAVLQTFCSAPADMRIRNYVVVPQQEQRPANAVVGSDAESVSYITPPPPVTARYSPLGDVTEPFGDVIELGAFGKLANDLYNANYSVTAVNFALPLHFVDAANQLGCGKFKVNG
jgi:hypothetical protein